MVVDCAVPCDRARFLLHVSSTTTAASMLYAPNITVNMSQIGFLISTAPTRRGGQTPISTQTCGCTWYGQQFISWSDPRMFSCLNVAQNPRELRFRGWIRWWSGNCMGHTEIEYDVKTVPTREDIFMYFPPCEYYVEDIRTRIEIAADGAQVLVDGQTNLTFTVTVTNRRSTLMQRLAPAGWIY